MTDSVDINLSPPWDQTQQDEYEKFAYLYENFARIKELLDFVTLSYSITNLAASGLVTTQLTIPFWFTSAYDVQLSFRASNDPYNVHLGTVTEFGDHSILGDPAQFAPSGFAVPPSGKLHLAIKNASSSAQTIDAFALLRKRS